MFDIEQNGRLKKLHIIHIKVVWRLEDVEGCLSIPLMKWVGKQNTQPFTSQIATSRQSIPHRGESRPEGVTEAKRTDEERQTGSLSRRSSQRHIWSLSYLRQVPRRRIKTSRASLLFNYSITQMETVITWKWCASATAAWCDLFFFCLSFFPFACGFQAAVEFGANWRQVWVVLECARKWVRRTHCRECRHHLATCQDSGRRRSAGRKKNAKTGSSTSGACVMCCHHPQHAADVSLPLWILVCCRLCLMRLHPSRQVTFHGTFILICNLDPNRLMKDPIGLCRKRQWFVKSKLKLDHSTALVHPPFWF